MRKLQVSIDKSSLNVLRALLRTEYSKKKGRDAVQIELDSEENHDIIYCFKYFEIGFFVENKSVYCYWKGLLHDKNILINILEYSLLLLLDDACQNAHRGQKWSPFLSQQKCRKAVSKTPNPTQIAAKLRANGATSKQKEQQVSPLPPQTARTVEQSCNGSPMPAHPFLSAEVIWFLSRIWGL